MSEQNVSTQPLLVSSRWQLIFVVLVLAGWLGSALYMVYSLAGSNYISAGMWVFQATTWLLPLAFLAVAFGALTKYAFGLNRLFMACLATVVGERIYSLVSMTESSIWYKYFAQPVSESDTSWWTAYGNAWIMMVICLAVFAGLIVMIGRHHQR